jgi:hypothetical protein
MSHGRFVGGHNVKAPSLPFPHPACPPITPDFPSHLQAYPTSVCPFRAQSFLHDFSLFLLIFSMSSRHSKPLSTLLLQAFHSVFFLFFQRTSTVHCIPIASPSLVHSSSLYLLSSNMFFHSYRTPIPPQLKVFIQVLCTICIL